MLMYPSSEPQEGHEWIASTGVIQRPKVVFSKQTGKYHVSVKTEAEFTFSIPRHPPTHACADDILRP
jgi:hypothetical protein